MKIITEEVKIRKKLCEFTKNGITKVARRYHINIQFVYKQLEKNDGTLKRLALKSRKLYFYPNSYNLEDIELIKKVKSRYGIDVLAEVYVRLKKIRYTIKLRN